MTTALNLVLRFRMSGGITPLSRTTLWPKRGKLTQVNKLSQQKTFFKGISAHAVCRIREEFVGKIFFKVFFYVRRIFLKFFAPEYHLMFFIW